MYCSPTVLNHKGSQDKSDAGKWKKKNVTMLFILSDISPIFAFFQVSHWNLLPLKINYKVSSWTGHNQFTYATDGDESEVDAVLFKGSQAKKGWEPLMQPTLSPTDQQEALYYPSVRRSLVPRNNRRVTHLPFYSSLQWEQEFLFLFTEIMCTWTI